MATHTLSSYQDAASALRNKDLKQSLYDEGAVVMDGVLLTLHGDEHHARRAMEFRVFRKGFFKHYEQEIFPQTLHQSLQPFLDEGGADLVEFGYRTTMNLTADFAGIDRPGKTAAETNALLRLVMKFSEGATLVHSTRDKDDVRREVQEAIRDFDEIFLKPSIARRNEILRRMAVGTLAHDALPMDVLAVLLQNEDQLDLPYDLLRREMAFYLQAGSHSTANSMVHAFHEIQTWLIAHEADKDRLFAEPLFLQRCVHESLRLHPASPVAWRRPVCPVKLPTGGAATTDQIVIDLHKANRDKTVYGDDANLFNPHREIPVGYAPYGLTFGIGGHTCLGRDLDGGILPKAGKQVENHQIGIVAKLVQSLFENSATVDPGDPPTEDANTKRNNWGRYPVRFSRQTEL